MSSRRTTQPPFFIHVEQPKLPHRDNLCTARSSPIPIAGSLDLDVIRTGTRRAVHHVSSRDHGREAVDSAANNNVSFDTPPLRASGRDYVFHHPSPGRLGTLRLGTWRQPSNHDTVSNEAQACSRAGDSPISKPIWEIACHCSKRSSIATARHDIERLVICTRHFIIIAGAPTSWNRSW